MSHRSGRRWQVADVGNGVSPPISGCVTAAQGEPHCVEDKKLVHHWGLCPPMVGSLLSGCHG